MRLNMFFLFIYDFAYFERFLPEQSRGASFDQNFAIFVAQNCKKIQKSNSLIFGVVNRELSVNSD